jgi:hypothetical protein
MLRMSRIHRILGDVFWPCGTHETRLKTALINAAQWVIVALAAAGIVYASEVKSWVKVHPQYLLWIVLGVVLLRMWTIRIFRRHLIKKKEIDDLKAGEK